VEQNNIFIDVWLGDFTVREGQRVETKMNGQIKIKCSKCGTIYMVSHDILISNSVICPRCGILNEKCGFLVDKDTY
jgi:hypothetical protein